MKYLLLVYSAESCWTDESRQACMQKSMKIVEELQAAGKYCDASPLHPVATATSVRVRNGERLITDGPFAETAEQLGGYYLIDVADLNEAIDIASRIPPANVGTVEVRPLFDLSELAVSSKLVSNTSRTGE